MSRPKNPVVEQAKDIILQTLEDGDLRRSELFEAVQQRIADMDMAHFNAALAWLKTNGDIKNEGAKGMWALARKKRRRDGSVGGGIKTTILEVLREGQFGRSEIIERTLQRMPSANPNTINTSLYALANEDEIVQIERGVWSLPNSNEDGLDHVQTPPSKPIQKGDDRSQDERAQAKLEEPFYKPFAKWLFEEVGECTFAIKLGSKVLGSKWGTPDVVGRYEVDKAGLYRRNEIVEFVSAEIKAETSQSPVFAFGQACAYLHFSHKVYLVLPSGISRDDKVRIESLCGIVGLGLVFFDPSKEDDPKFDIRVRPIHREPDTLALNNVLRRLYDSVTEWH